MEVIEYNLLISFSFNQNIFQGAQCVGDTKQTQTCATSTNCPSILIL